ncbi:MAG: hypothetical protein DHS20C08_01420 [Rhodomicrobium sp.]|nr:MAG: hypothetical protein DHS20C08_01420 [Rhodomicrobium sp.]
MTILKTAILTFIALVMQIGIAVAQDDSSSGQQQKVGAEGVWQTKMGKSHVKIIECGASLCNEIIWLKQPNDKAGRPHTDKLNVNSSQRGRPILGLSVLTNTKQVNKGYWRGRIYDPERGKSYMALIKLLSPEKLQVKGCLNMGPPFCKTHIWKKIGSVEDYEKLTGRKTANQ